MNHQRGCLYSKLILKYDEDGAGQQFVMIMMINDNRQLAISNTKNLNVWIDLKFSSAFSIIITYHY